MTVRTRSATCPDRETAQWATQQVVTGNEQKIRRRLALGTRARLAIEAARPSRVAPVGRVLLQAMCARSRPDAEARPFERCARAGAARSDV
ncbi:hypothetical protein ACFYY1_13275 [Streptomyces sp. NPDC001890]|uniref:hypothetical protein n=1 Tax=Streptomyces sp. NPDC001890 TaxID=3364620 RepID=UPI00368BE72B